MSSLRLIRHRDLWIQFTGRYSVFSGGISRLSRCSQTRFQFSEFPVFRTIFGDVNEPSNFRFFWIVRFKNNHTCDSFPVCPASWSPKSHQRHWRPAGNWKDLSTLCGQCPHGLRARTPHAYTCRWVPSYSRCSSYWSYFLIPKITSAALAPCRQLKGPQPAVWTVPTQFACKNTPCIHMSMAPKLFPMLILLIV